MSEITIGLIVVALILISLNITIELIQRDFMGLGSIGGKNPPVVIMRISDPRGKEFPFLH